MIVIIGAGVSGLSLSYFLSSYGIKSVTIELRESIGKNHRSTCLVSSKIFKLLNFLKDCRDLLIKEYEIANFWYNDEKILSLKSFNRMFLLDYLKLEREIYKNVDKTFASFCFGEKVLDVDLDKKVLITNRRKIYFDYLVDASGTYSFLANKLNLFKSKKVYSSFEILAKVYNDLEDINIFINKEYSKKKFGWLIRIDRENALIGLIDLKLSQGTFRDFINSFNVTKILYEYFHPILYAELRKLTLKNSIIIGEAAGLVKPFSLGGIVYGIISSFLALKAIKNNNIETYEKRIRRTFHKPKIIGKIADRLVKCRYFLKALNFSLLNKYTRKLDPDFLF